MDGELSIQYPETSEPALSVPPWAAPNLRAVAADVAIASSHAAAPSAGLPGFSFISCSKFTKKRQFLLKITEKEGKPTLRAACTRGVVPTVARLKRGWRRWRHTYPSGTLLS